MPKQKLANWTNYPIIEVDLEEESFEHNLIKSVSKASSVIARGNGRCYGDASLNDHVVSTLKLKNILSFDAKSGVIEAESGILLSDLLDFIVPYGWFLPVTPGTKFITLGGAIASNVHGKNHHSEGSFSNHVIDFTIITSNGTKERVSIKSNPDLFNSTLGGLGLTGIVVSARIQLKKISSTKIEGLNIKAKNLEEVFSLFEKHKNVTYSVAWIDCYQKGKNLGRSILMLGEHLESNDPTQLGLRKSKNLNIKFFFPGWILNKLSIRIFNFLYYHKQFKRSKKVNLSYESFFYPLDFVHNWNRIYGRSGFLQYQFVLPLETSYEGLMSILSIISQSKFGSFLAVLKLFGKSDNLISFPMEGYTLALDFPIKKGLFEFLDRLDKEVLKFKGRVYLSKDARMSSDFFRKSNAHSLNVWDQLMNSKSPKFESFLSKRLSK